MEIQRKKPQANENNPLKKIKADAQIISDDTKAAEIISGFVDPERLEEERKHPGRPKNPDIQLFQRATFIVEKNLLKRLRQYVAKENLLMTDVINGLIYEYLKDKDTTPEDEKTKKPWLYEAKQKKGEL